MRMLVFKRSVVRGLCVWCVVQRVQVRMQVSVVVSVVVGGVLQVCRHSAPPMLRRIPLSPLSPLSPLAPLAPLARALALHFRPLILHPLPLPLQHLHT